MRILIVSSWLVCTALVISVYAEEADIYAEYDREMQTRKVRIPVNVGFKVNQPINRARRQVNANLEAARTDANGETSTLNTGRDIVNVGGLVIPANSALRAQNIVIVSRPGGVNFRQPEHGPRAEEHK